ncbi:hypothetical protein F4823DRAFT_559745 [Ustulina deusta]|nr:hypothetical protein F4823DRAFT_559745 [Ustulina deusta]
MSRTTYCFLLFAIVAYRLPMEMIEQLFTLMLFVAAPLFARASSEDAAEVVIDAMEQFACLVALLLFVVLVRAVDEVLGLTSFPAKFFEIMSSW